MFYVHNILVMNVLIEHPWKQYLVVRTFNPDHTKTVKNVDKNIFSVLKNSYQCTPAVPGPSKYSDTLAMIPTSIRLRTPLPSPGKSSTCETTVDTSRERILKRKICELQHNDIIKNVKIRELQKKIWRQKNKFYL
ncbi:unnamed protein product [Psylliodes chrysocephalus]|uniref:Uncharacterized protein n=1 Tax=Psylliodes chrysocephalus TaxID=3402493 RepID=A0A9P0G9V0_9CUCU|nr:unnamed protein product [Psylliodes chrysocephala]